MVGGHEGRIEHSTEPGLNTLGRAAASLALDWDPWGSLTRYGSSSLAWDEANRLTRFDRSGSTVCDADHHYLPGTWNRYKRTQAGGTEYYVYDGDNVAGSYASNGSLNARYVTPGLDRNLSMTRGGSTYYYMADGLGSVRNVLDSSEVVQNTYDYYAFGNTLTASPADVTNPYRYTGREYESGGVLDMHYYRNRYYVAGLGIFASRDAMWADAGRGWGYVGNSPVVYKDPTGLLKVCCRPPDYPPVVRHAIIHCELKNSCDKDDTQEYPVWPDKYGNRSADNGTKCSAMTISMIEDCLRRNPCSAGLGEWGNNCNSKTSDAIGRCCLKSNWDPPSYAGDRRGVCIEWAWRNYDAGNGHVGCYPVCVKWDHADWRDRNVPDDYDPTVPVIPDLSNVRDPRW